MKHLYKFFSFFVLFFFFGITSARADTLVKCDFEGSNPNVCYNATASYSSGDLDNTNPLTGLTSITTNNTQQTITFDEILNGAFNPDGFSIAFKFKRNPNWWISGGLRLADNTVLPFSNSDGGKLMQNTEDYWWVENGWGNYNLDYYWIIGNYTSTGNIYYNNNLEWASPYHGRATWDYQSYTSNSPISFEFFTGGGAITYDDFQVFDHILTENERTELIETGEISGGGGSGSNDYAMYYGDQPYYAESSKAVNMPVVYNVCEQWDNSKTHYLVLENADNDSEQWGNSRQTLTSCSGSVIFNQISPDEGASNYSRFSIKEVDGETETDLATTDNFLFSIYATLAEQGNFLVSNLKTNLYIDTNLISTTTARVSYRLYLETLEGYEICYIRNKTKTSICQGSLSPGLSFVELAIPSETEAQNTLISFGLFDNTEKKLLESPTIMATFGAGVVDPTSDPVSDATIGYITCPAFTGGSVFNIPTNIFEVISCKAFNETISLFSSLKVALLAPFKIILYSLNNLFPFSLVMNLYADYNTAVVNVASAEHQEVVIEYPFLNNETITLKFVDPEGMEAMAGSDFMDLLKGFMDLTVVALFLGYLWSVNSRIFNNESA